MRRRDFIKGISWSAATWPIAARAQLTTPPTIGYLGATTAAAQKQWVDAFLQGLNDLGWIEGRTVVVEYRWGEGRRERIAQVAAELVARKVDLILAGGTAPAIASKQATSTIPIVFGLAGDPVGTGLAAALAHPGGNVTGLSDQAVDLAGKRLEIVRDLIPACRRMAILANSEYPGLTPEMNEIKAAARRLDLEVTTSQIRQEQDIAPALDALKGRVEAVYLVGDPLLNSQRVRIAALALDARLPTIFVQREYVDAGGLISYGPNIPSMFRRAANYVDKILRGAKPGDLPIEQPTKFDFVINLKTAKALGIKVPPPMMARADDVIE